MRLLSWIFGKKKPSATRTEGLGSVNSEVPRHQETSYRQPSTLRTETSFQINWRDESYPMEVVGESHYQPAFLEICGPHSRYGYDVKLAAVLELEPSNPYDPNAIRVLIQGKTVGYLSREQAARVGQQMRNEQLRNVGCNAKVRGGWRSNQHDEGTFGVWLAVPTWGWIDFGTGRPPPENAQRRKVVRPEPADNGPLLGEWVAIIGAPSNGALAQRLAAKGAHIMASVGKSTTLVVLAEERPFNSGLTQSSQYRAAEQRIKEGRPLRIASESEV